MKEIEFACWVREEDVIYVMEDLSPQNTAFSARIGHLLINECRKQNVVRKAVCATIATMRNNDYGNIDIMRRIEQQIENEDSPFRTHTKDEMGCMVFSSDYPAITFGEKRCRVHMVMAALNHHEETGRCVPMVADGSFGPSDQSDPLYLNKLSSLHAAHFCGNKKCTRKDHIGWVHVNANIRIHELCHTNPGMPCTCRCITGRRCLVRKSYSEDRKREIKNDILWLARAVSAAKRLQYEDE